MPSYNYLPSDKYSPPQLLALYSDQSSSSSAATYRSYTFNDNFDQVIIYIQMHDTDNNNDNYCKVYDVAKANTTFTTWRNDTDSMWDSYDFTTDITNPTNTSIAVNANYSQDADKNKTLYYATGTSSSTAFTRIFYKSNVKIGDTAHIYYNTYRRGLISIFGIN